MIILSFSLKHFSFSYSFSYPSQFILASFRFSYSKLLCHLFLVIDLVLIPKFWL